MTSKLNRFNVLTHLYRIENEDFIKNMESSFYKISRDYGVKVSVKSLTGLELTGDLNTMQKKANEFSRYLLFIQEVGGTKMEDTIITMNLDASLVYTREEGGEQLLWRARIEFELLNFIDDEATSNILVNAILEQLKHDNII